MHSYLRAIGFSNIKNRTQLEQIIGTIMESPDVKNSFSIGPKNTLVQFTKNFTDMTGISLYGEYDEKGFFYLEHYAPIAVGPIVSTKEMVMFNKRVDNDSYTGMCDDIRIGVSLIFYLQNIIEYLKHNAKGNTKDFADIRLSALSTKGTILLGLDNANDCSNNRASDFSRRTKLINDAKNGSQEAIDTLAFSEIDTHAMVTRRIKNEDVYTIVENSFYPYGSESDSYTIVGTILNCSLHTNCYTNEQIYHMLISCNDLTFPVYINKMDLLGEPKEGRRFKGNIWMQGYIDFEEI